MKTIYFGHYHVCYKYSTEIRQMKWNKKTNKKNSTKINILSTFQMGDKIIYEQDKAYVLNSETW